ncbi:MAG: acylphosphatase [Actinomycetota bacterium]|nr:acylphosphatase [Actinomycetota bacterium]
MSTNNGSAAEPVRLSAWVRGRVQGVGFRWWVRSRALALGLAGTATNLDDGRVLVVAEGSRSACERLLAELTSGGAPGYVAGVTERWSAARGQVTGFSEQ